MKNWRQLLRENDPGVDQMDADTAARMRAAVVRAASTPHRSPAVWPMRVALAGFAGVVLMLSILATQVPHEIAPPAFAPVAGTERRQIQFATPGGTRIIWELNPKFTLMETLP